MKYGLVRLSAPCFFFCCMTCLFLLLSRYQLYITLFVRFWEIYRVLTQNHSSVSHLGGSSRFRRRRNIRVRYISGAMKMGDDEQWE